MAAPAPAAFSTQQRQKSLTSTGPHVQAVSLTSQQVLQRLRSWCLSSNITTNLQAKTNSWFNYKSLSWGITEEWDDMKLSWNSRCSLSRLRDTGIVGPRAKQGDEDTRPHWKEELEHTSETWGKYTADLKCFGWSVHQKLLKWRINLISMTTGCIITKSFVKKTRIWNCFPTNGNTLEQTPMDTGLPTFSALRGAGALQ